MIPPALHKNMKEFDTAWKKLCVEIEGLSDEQRAVRLNEMRLLDVKWLDFTQQQRAEAYDFYYGGPKPKPLSLLVPIHQESTTYPDFQSAFSF